MKILDRFLNYVSIPTTSNSNSNTSPSTIEQKVLANYLVKELKELGINDIIFDDNHCYVYAYIKGNDDCNSIGFVSHLDTSEDAKGNDIKPQIIKNYDGNDIKLNNDKILSVKNNPDLKKHIGKTLITTDGTTLLGADDKAGIAEIVTMIEYIKKNNIDHGDIFICFTPDEEIGLGTNYIDTDIFKPDFAYTIDGSDLGEISYENFNAASIEINIKGVNVHAGLAKGIMVNSLLIANELNYWIPNTLPSNTEGYQGYYHLEKIEGNVSSTKMEYIIRDFSKDEFEKKKHLIEKIVSYLNKKYNNCIELKITDTYYNMYNMIYDKRYIIDIATKAMNNLNIKPLIIPTRGGTDGATLSYMGIPCPNIGAGGHNFHSIYEYVCLEDMINTSNLLTEIVKENNKVKRK